MPECVQHAPYARVAIIKVLCVQCSHWTHDYSLWHLWYFSVYMGPSICNEHTGIQILTQCRALFRKVSSLYPFPRNLLYWCMAVVILWALLSNIVAVSPNIAMAACLRIFPYLPHIVFASHLTQYESCGWNLVV